jgi:putative phosphoribosyl transferase
MVFSDRFEAGQFLAQKLQQYRDNPGVLVLALPRGGVPVGFEIAKALRAPLDVFLVRKLGVPGREELAMGAVASGGIQVLNGDVCDSLGISDDAIQQVSRREREELERQQEKYRHGQPALEIQNRTIILVDDGLATGSTMRAAIKALEQRHPRRLVVVVPVGAPETCAELSQEVDELVCGVRPEQFVAVGLWYADFAPTTDSVVQELLEEARNIAGDSSVKHGSAL